MKRFLSLLLTAILALSLCACSQKTESERKENFDTDLLKTTDEKSSDMEEFSETVDSVTDTENITDEPEQQDNQSAPSATEQSKQESEENKIPANQSLQTPTGKTNNPAITQPEQDTPPIKEQTPQKPVVTETPKPEPPAEKEENPPITEAEPNTPPSTEQEETTMPTSDYKVKITVGSQELTATIYNNATGRDLIEKLPMTLPMLDLYGREMCYRFPEALETDNVQYTGYEVGEIVYWPPRHSFVILYAQNGEQFDMQKIGKIDSGIEIFDGIGDVEITIELIS